MLCVNIVDNGNDQQRRSRPAKERALELAEAIHQDNGKGKCEKKEQGGCGVGVSNNNNAPNFVVG